MKELLDIVDELGNPTGETADRGMVHHRGLRHRTAHVWLLRRTPRGRTEVLVQRRAQNKDSYPGCWDVSSAGHIPAGVEWIPSALRELKEELGLAVHPRQLVFLVKRSIDRTGVFHGRRFIDRQVSAVYLLAVPFGRIRLRAQRSEIDALKWVSLDVCIHDVESGGCATCIEPEELHWIAEHPAAGPKKRLHSLRFDVWHGPEAVFERGRRIPNRSDGVSVQPFEMRHPRAERHFPDGFLRGMVQSGAFAQRGTLVGCQVRRDTGRVVQTYWNVPLKDESYRVVCGCQAGISTIKRIAKPNDRPFRRVETKGPAYNFAERINQALLDVENRKSYLDWEIRAGSTLALGLEYYPYGRPSSAPSWLKDFKRIKPSIKGIESGGRGWK